MWKIPKKYSCTYGGEVDNWACSQDKDIPCWVSRPYEKEIFLTYMALMSFVSLLVVFLDFFYVIQKVSVKRMRRRRVKKNLQKQGEDTSELFPINEAESEQL